MTQLDNYDRVTAANADVLLQVRSAQRHMGYLQRTLASRERARRDDERRSADGLRADAAEGRARRLPRHAREPACLRRAADRRAERPGRGRRRETRRSHRGAGRAVPRRCDGPPATPATVSDRRQGSSRSSPPRTNCPGHTARGLPVGWGIAAVDPSVIPLGTRFIVPGYGDAVAADTGWAIVGARSTSGSRRCPGG